MAKTKWTLDPTHSEIQFKIRHLMISNVTGEFKNYSAEVETEGEDFMTARVVFTADINSVTTGAEQRDQHLKSADFLTKGLASVSFPRMQLRKVDQFQNCKKNLSPRQLQALNARTNKSSPLRDSVFVAMC